MMFDYTITTRSHVVAGNLKVLMTVGPKRSKVYPDVPSATELGMPSIEHMGWSAILAPAGTPTEIIGRLNQELVKVVRSDDILQAIIEGGGDPDAVGKTPTEVAAFIRREQDSLAALIKLTGMTAD
jgi:tripartite-type tricarboxylate transporter receptor subunit TctC